MLTKEELEKLDIDLCFIRALPVDWDAEGARIVSKLALKRVKEFLNIDIVSAAPVCTPRHDGSIDLYWKEDDYCLLMNFNDERVGFYGETKFAWRYNKRQVNVAYDNTWHDNIMFELYKLWTR